MLFLASGQLRYIVIGAALLIVAGVVGYGLIGRVQSRIDTWLNPWADASGTSYQVVQSMIALNSGGVIWTSAWAWSILTSSCSAAHTDMLLAAIGEELGLAGTLAVVACFGWITPAAWPAGGDAGAHDLWPACWPPGWRSRSAGRRGSSWRVIRV